MEINSEDLARWYFRLNGFFIIQNLVVHQEHSRQATEIDILGVRFGNRKELDPKIMVDDDCWTQSGKNVLVLVDTTKSNGGSKGKACKINSGLFNRERKVQERILNFVGCFSNSELVSVAASLYAEKIYVDDSWLVRVCAIGDFYSNDLPDNVIQLTWEDILKFIHNRFITFAVEKKDHSQWDYIGRGLFTLCMENNKEDDFIRSITLLPGR